MSARQTEQVSRSWWLLLLYGVAAVVFGVAILLWPGRSVWAMVMALGVLSVVDGLVSLASIFRKDLALPAWMLVAYGLLSLLFGVLALSQPLLVAESLLWVLAFWLIVAGIARIVFAIQIRKLVKGEWMLILSGLLALALGVLFLARPGVGLLTVALWVAWGVIAYGILQMMVAFRMRKAADLLR
ncbi:HdeD family acid-resistance protein [Pseudoxanthomonas dokdonensis]|uniref:HdeD family acid-resistance protein n=1 Tax=Pseudoxanthomonas dokdonensis TaxID=344882 RepID=A0A0R0CQH6_9GAMM|nr:DUF308 domain-containing protein [Pseudoxanthomonas dokdonensis]KRG68506.1 hypothetical protein ABB29_12875 [Pseudoxanthomonas dokdonensis]